MKIYTKSGDKGETSLYGGKRVSKSDIRIEAYGTVDEVNSYIGLLGDLEVNKNRKGLLKEIQDRLFTIGSALAADADKPKLKKPDLLESDIELLEKEIDVLQEQLPEMKSFILPGGHQHVSFCHLARTVCRRAERIVVLLAETEPVETIIIMYLNRLSDYLFVLSRKMAMELGVEEIPWKPRY
jgi:cob(I)alamin adenosyltransferase